MHIVSPKIGSKTECTICHKIFTFTEEHKYICNGGYTCSWKCFLDYCKRNDKPEETPKKNNTPVNASHPEPSPIFTKTSPIEDEEQDDNQDFILFP